MPQFAANLTLLFTEVPMLDRPDWARRTGFDGVEYSLNWQVKAQGGEWQDIGEHGETLKVEVTAENIGSAWRVTVETAD